MPPGYNPGEMCGASNGDDACILRKHEGDHVAANGNRW